MNKIKLLQEWQINGKATLADEQARERIKIQSAEIERLKALHNPEIVPAAAHMILTQRDEIERLKWLLREAADDIEHWSGYVPEYFVEKYKADDDIKKYREAGEVTK